MTEHEKEAVRQLGASIADLRSRLAAAEAARDRAEAWQLAVADGLGYVNRPEGQGGYEVAEPSVIIDAVRAAEAAREAAQASDKRAREMFDVTRHRICDRLGLPHGTSWSNVEEAVRALASPRTTPPEAAPRLVECPDCGTRHNPRCPKCNGTGAVPATPPEATAPASDGWCTIPCPPGPNTCAHGNGRCRWFTAPRSSDTSCEPPPATAKDGQP